MSAGWNRYKPRSKYGNDAVKTLDQRFDSQLEQAYNDRLAMYVKTGDIQEFEYHPDPVILLPAPKIAWRIDFRVIGRDGLIFYVETKGMDDPTYILKRKIYENLAEEKNLPPLLIIKGKRQRNGDWTFRPDRAIGMEEIDFLDIR